MIFDTHAHLNCAAFDPDREELIKKCSEQAFGMINVGTNYESSVKAVEMAQRHDGLYAAVGLHPSNIDSAFYKSKEDHSLPENFLEKQFDRSRYAALCHEPKVVAIGECGLDYWRRPKGENKKEGFKAEQRDVFEKQATLAEELDLPLIIHCRDAFDDVINILSRSKAKGVMHCFTGSLAQMEALLKLDFYMGFNGIIFKTDLKEAILRAPLEKILIETDCPYLSPPSFEERNDPRAVFSVIKEIAKIKGLSEEEVAAETSLNAQKAFKL